MLEPHYTNKHSEINFSLILMSLSKIQMLYLQLTSQYMVNSMVKLRFRVNDIVLVSIRNSCNIDGDLNNWLKHISGRKHWLHDQVLCTWRTRWTSILFDLYVDTFWENGKDYLILIVLINPLLPCSHTVLINIEIKYGYEYQLYH
jgi:hypothetical protein